MKLFDSKITSLKVGNALGRSSNELQSVFERLSSGMRINRASDDAAGLAIADSLRADARVYNQGVRNLNDGLSLLNIADGALNELTEIVVRLKELSTQAATGSLSSIQRKTLNQEAQSLSDEYLRITQSTKFNDRSLFSAEFGALTLQAGYDSISSDLGGDIGTGTFSEYTSFTDSDVDIPTDIETGDVNGDGILDLVVAELFDNDITVFLGTGSGAFEEGITLTTGTQPTDVILSDTNNDGILDIISIDSLSSQMGVYLGLGNGTFANPLTMSVGNRPDNAAAADFNGDGIVDLAIGSVLDDNMNILIGVGDGTFVAGDIYSVSSYVGGVSTADFDGDGHTDIVFGGLYSGGSHDAIVMFGNGDGTFSDTTTMIGGTNIQTISTGDFNNDGLDDLVVGSAGLGDLRVYLAGADRTFALSEYEALADEIWTTDVGDFNGDGILDIVSASAGTGDTVDILIGNGDGTFNHSSITSPGEDPYTLVSGDFDGDGVYDLAVGHISATREIAILLGDSTSGVAPLLNFSLNTISDAKQALSQFTQKLDHLTLQRGEIGAYMSRINIAESHLSSQALQATIAEGRIRDADIAFEAARMVRLQILQQAGAAVLGQANLNAQLVLDLLSFD